MDEVMSNFKKLYLAEHTATNIYPQSRPGFFQDLEPLPGAIEAVKSLIDDDRYDVYILTAPSYMNPYCYMDKRIWIEKYFGIDFCKRLIICYYKNLLDGDILIDDSEKNGQLKFNGEVITFGSNKYPNWDAVLPYLESHSLHSNFIHKQPTSKLNLIDMEIDIDSHSMVEYIQKLQNKYQNKDIWQKKILSYLTTCSDADIEKYLQWEKEYQRYYYEEMHTETSSNIFENVISIIDEIGEDVYEEESLKPNRTFMGSAYKYRGYTILSYHGQGVYFSVLGKNGEQII